MFKLNVQVKIFYSKTMESFLSIIVRKHGYRNMLEEIKWLTVQNVELTFPIREKHGRWLDVQTAQEKECN